MMEFVVELSLFCPSYWLRIVQLKISVDNCLTTPATEEKLWLVNGLSEEINKCSSEVFSEKLFKISD